MFLYIFQFLAGQLSLFQIKMNQYGSSKTGQIDQFGLLSTQNAKVARFAHNVEYDFLGDLNVNHE